MKTDGINPAAKHALYEQWSFSTLDACIQMKHAPPHSLSNNIVNSNRNSTLDTVARLLLEY
jgi:hypothetical protein